MEILIVSDAYRCRHKEWQDGHCAEDMSCANYINRCPRHSLTGNLNAECTLKVLGKRETR